MREAQRGGKSSASCLGGKENEKVVEVTKKKNPGSAFWGKSNGKSVLKTRRVACMQRKTRSFSSEKENRAAERTETCKGRGRKAEKGITSYQGQLELLGKLELLEGKKALRS